MKLPSAGLAALALATGAQTQAQAQTPPQPSTRVQDVVVTARRPTHLAGVTVTATDWCPEPNPARYPADRAPRVLDSYPAQGGVVPPGYTLVRVSFDAPMSCYSEVSVDGPGEPCEPDGTWELPARRSWKMMCRLEPGTEYRVRFKKQDGLGFVGLSGREAEPYELAFTTSQGPPTPTKTAAARLDPGPPGGRAASAYVTCADETAAARGGDCSHARFAAAPQPR
jgi:hypothetical protein